MPNPNYTGGFAPSQHTRPRKPWHTHPLHFLGVALLLLGLIAIKLHCGEVRLVPLPENKPLSKLQAHPLRLQQGRGGLTHEPEPNRVVLCEAESIFKPRTAQALPHHTHRNKEQPLLNTKAQN